MAALANGLKYLAEEADDLNALVNALNNPPTGYVVDSWQAVYFNGVCYTVVYKKIAAALNVGYR